jgi:serine/threonine protein kinase
MLGSYEVTALLGMGEVYRARDTRLKRDVAIKTLPEEFGLNTDRVNRFQREAELPASLNHPNIAAFMTCSIPTGPASSSLNWWKGKRSPTAWSADPFQSLTHCTSPGRSATRSKRLAKRASSIEI